MKQLIYLFSLLILPLSASFAQLQVVTNNNDSGSGSLRTAITNGNLTNAPYSITFTTAGPINLTSVLPEITQSCTISGQTSLTPTTASGGTTIQRSSLASTNFRILKAATANKNLTLQDLILQNGIGNEGSDRRGGGGLFAELGSGGLTMNRCLVRNCSGFIQRDGGGVQVVTGSATITDCQFSNNSATGSYGGGFRTGRDSAPNSSPIILQRCTFLGNEAYFGGGFFQHGTSAILVNCTFSSNSSRISGNAVRLNSGNIDLIHCSFIANTTSELGETFINYGAGTARLTNCLFSGNINEWDGTNNFLNWSNGLITSLGGNVSSDADGLFLNHIVDKNSQNLPVGPLQRNNGGLVSTHSINSCSLAYNAGLNPPGIFLPSTDANSQPRTSTRDAGAFETQTVLPTAVAGSITVLGRVGCEFGGRLTAQVTGSSFTVTGPGSYFFSDTFHSVGPNTAVAEGIRLGGTYTLTVTSGLGCPTATSSVVVQGPSSCP